jgi:hypothetical protein
MREACALLCQLIDDRSLIVVRAITTNIPDAEIIREDEDDIRLVCSFCFPEKNY